MRREATDMKVRQNLGELLNQVQYRGDSIVVTKDGKPVAAGDEDLLVLADQYPILTPAAFVARFLS